MTSLIAQWTRDVRDVRDVGRMAAFWSQALGYRADQGTGGSVKLYPPAGSEGAPTVWLQGSAGPESDKNRAHPDLVAADPAAEVGRWLALGARRGDVGQKGDERFTVLADPEGNEFCVLDGPPS